MRCTFTNRTIGMTSFSIGTNPTIGTNGPSVWRIVSVCVYWTCVFSTDDCVESNSKNYLICIDELLFRINPPSPPPHFLKDTQRCCSRSHPFQEQILNFSSLTRFLSNSSVFYFFPKLEPGENRNFLFWSFSRFKKNESSLLHLR